ncbi:hypothetical protein [Curtobacterium sp. 9128]|uniref:hypothetical protein n=1 Tax=Curtobacterium sp. 9128 TaxID=1793722 RepID=UPI0011A5158D|nr:hypothetical protein [Curtobacterium sp. 9128]
MNHNVLIPVAVPLLLIALWSPTAQPGDDPLAQVRKLTGGVSKVLRRRDELSEVQFDVTDHARRGFRHVLGTDEQP